MVPPSFSKHHCRTVYDYSTAVAHVKHALNLPELFPGGTLAYCTDKDGVAKLMKKIDHGPMGKLKMAVIVEGIYLW